jgi:hypothetical protein
MRWRTTRQPLSRQFFLFTSRRGFRLMVRARGYFKNRILFLRGAHKLALSSARSATGWITMLSFIQSEERDLFWDLLMPKSEAARRCIYSFEFYYTQRVNAHTTHERKSERARPVRIFSNPIWRAKTTCAAESKALRSATRLGFNAAVPVLTRVTP